MKAYETVRAWRCRRGETLCGKPARTHFVLGSLAVSLAVVSFPRLFSLTGFAVANWVTPFVALGLGGILLVLALGVNIFVHGTKAIARRMGSAEVGREVPHQPNDFRDTSSRKLRPSSSASSPFSSSRRSGRRLKPFILASLSHSRDSEASLRRGETRCWGGP